MEANDITLLFVMHQTPHQAPHLKIIELSPNLLKLPDNLPEAEEHSKNHTQVIKNLQVGRNTTFSFSWCPSLSRL